MSDNLISAFDNLEKEKGLSRNVIKSALEDALITAYKQHYGTNQNVEIEFDQTKGSVAVYRVKEVVEEVNNDEFEIALEDAKEIHRAYEPGDRIRKEVTPKDFGRIAAQSAKQVIMQRLREAERSVIYDEYIQYEDDLINGTVERQDRKFVYVNIGKVEAVMSQHDQMKGEEYHTHDRIKVYVSKVEDSTKGPQIFVSRTHPGLVKRLFEQEVPEIYDGTVEIMSIAREAGDRSKIAVRSHDENVDPVGTCVGPRGQRVQMIVNELGGENMDIVEWNSDPAVLIKNALNPAQVLDVTFDEEEEACTVIVPEYQLSLAIGRRGQNVRLAAKLTGYKIDIKSDEEVNWQSSDEEPLFEQDIETDEFFDQLDDSTDEEAEESEDFFSDFYDESEEDN